MKFLTDNSRFKNIINFGENFDRQGTPVSMQMRQQANEDNVYKYINNLHFLTLVYPVNIWNRTPTIGGQA